MLFKILIISLLTWMVYNLFRALMIMNKQDPNGPPMSKFIGRRVLTSVVIVLLLLLGILTGVITPNPRPM
ncbi:DUF2909 domain-containing protein [Thalassotalea euphylliae]|uniref:DUF2909 domain-containing protein n=1 Tax=Thalassotalea euphylliae TaxID=1655234 RepID=A0A3E0U786_9GAMM|nr:DUF2909 domain-containing protein [Thalassotalea euphylliae]REL32689.1 DUF2909 domain-containing protein [Thalassotalea euphylliae]